MSWRYQLGSSNLMCSEKAMAPHSSTLAWKIPWTEEPGRLQSMGSLRVGHDWATSLSLFTFMHRRRKWQPTPVFLPGESQGRGSLVGCRLWGRTELDTTEVTSQQQQQQSNVSFKAVFPCFGDLSIAKSGVLKPPTLTPHLAPLLLSMSLSFPSGASCKEPACQCRRHKRRGFHCWVRKIPWRRAVFLLGESHGQRSLVGYSPWE